MEFILQKLIWQGKEKGGSRFYRPLVLVFLQKNPQKILARDQTKEGFPPVAATNNLRVFIAFPDRIVSRHFPKQALRYFELRPYLVTASFFVLRCVLANIASAAFMAR